MSAVMDTLRAILSGNPLERGRLLPACTAEAFGTEAFGESPIRELFARNPAPLSPRPHLIVRDRYTAVFDADESGREQALIAETYDERIARLWRVGEGVADMTAEPALRVAIDPFLSQMREAVAFNAEEFPYLDAHAGPVVADALAEVSAGDLQATDAADRRVVALRALSAGALTAVLAQVLCPRSAPILIAIALRLQGGTSVRTWRVSDGLRPQRVLVDLTASRAIGREEHT